MGVDPRTLAELTRAQVALDAFNETPPDPQNSEPLPAANGKEAQEQTHDEAILANDDVSDQRAASISFSLGTSKFDNLPVQRTAHSFDALRDELLSVVSPQKGMAFFCAPLAVGLHNDQAEHPGEKPWRLARLVLPRSFISFDCDGFGYPDDDTAPSPAACHAQFVDGLPRFKGFAHTTSSHTDDLPRMRVTLALSRPVTRAEAEHLGKELEPILAPSGGVEFDPCVYRGEQPCYLPVQLPDAAPFKTWRFDGEVVNPDQFLVDFVEPSAAAERESKQWSPDEVSRAESALLAIPNTFARPDWFKLLSAAKEAGVSQEVAESWSNTYAYPTERDARKAAYVFPSQWRSITVGKAGGVTEAFLYAEATKAGWVDPEVEKMFAPVLPNGSLREAERMQAIDRLLSKPDQHLNAEAFAMYYGERLKYAVDVGKWFFFDGGLWVKDELKSVSHLVRMHCFSVRGAKAHEHKYHAAVEKMCMSDPVFACRACDTFDQDNYLLNTPAGVVDLRTGNIVPATQAMMLSKVTAVAPSKDTPFESTRFAQFMREITGNDGSLIEYHQVSLGACLSGAIESHWLLFWIGSGRNGKNTLGDLVMWILNDYAKKVPATTLMAKDHESHPTEVANLMGARLVVSSEVEQGAFWGESKVNELTGDARISARFMRQDHFEFDRTHKHLIFGNNRPRLKTTTEALKARIKIVPFNVSFIGREDGGLPKNLETEAGAVLQWLIEGHVKWLKAGRKLPPCAAVDAETSDYFGSQTTVDGWIGERLNIVPDDGRAVAKWPTASGLYADYSMWMRQRGEAPLSTVVFGEAMKRKFDSALSHKITHYLGCELVPFSTPDDDAPSWLKPMGAGG